MKSYRLGMTLCGLVILFVCLGWGKKGAADVEMNRLCSINGGVFVYETVSVPKSQFDKFGTPRGRNWNGSDDAGVLDPEFLNSSTSIYLMKGDTLKGEVNLFKFEERAQRVSDGKLLALSVSYGRSGGDHLIHRVLGGHPSIAGCPQASRTLISRVFLPIRD